MFKPSGGLSSPLSSKGDIWVYSSTDAAQAVGANGSILTADSTQTTGLKWSPAGTAAFNVLSKVISYGATINDYIICSSSSFNVTLPTAVGVPGQQVVVEHNGVNLSQVYTILTTSGQTINGPGGTVTSGNYILATTGEVAAFISDGANWQVAFHKTDTGWNSDTTANIQYLTFTVTSASATIAATYRPAYVFTITAGNTATAGAVYSNNGNNYTLAANLLAGDTTVVFTGASAPQASGTLTYVSGTHTGGNLSFSSVVGDAATATSTYTVAQTIAAQVTLITTGLPTSINPSASGKLVKTGGTGDAVITYSLYSGTAISTVTATTTPPSFFGAPTTNTVKWRRQGSAVVLNFIYGQATAGAAAGSGDYIFSLPSGMTVDTTIISTISSGTGTQVAVAAANPALIPTTGSVTVTGTAGGAGVNTLMLTAYLYSSTQYRISAVSSAGSGTVAYGSVGSAGFSATNTALLYNWTITLPISGWQP